MDRATRELVRTRANRRCEYCGIHEDDDFVLPFHIEHIRARKHGGRDDTSNLALACHHCNLCKGPNLSGVDSETNSIVVLFDPRRDNWNVHFVQRVGVIVGITATGRATVDVLAMNRTDRVRLRQSSIRDD